MAESKGLLLVLTEPSPLMEDEFNDWYDTEHIPERASVPGFETALRFISLGDGPRYAAIYDLANLEVLESDAYRAVAIGNFSPWTKRVTDRVRPLRMTGRQADGPMASTGRCARLLLLKFAQTKKSDAQAISAGLNASFAKAPGHLRSRLFEGVEPQAGYHVAITEFSTMRMPELQPDTFGACGQRIELAATYRPYR